MWAEQKKKRSHIQHTRGWKDYGGFVWQWTACRNYLYLRWQDCIVTSRCLPGSVRKQPQTPSAGRQSCTPPLGWCSLLSKRERERMTPPVLLTHNDFGWGKERGETLRERTFPVSASPVQNPAPYANKNAAYARQLSCICIRRTLGERAVDVQFGPDVLFSQ